MRAFVAVNLPADERRRLHLALAPLHALDLPVRWLPAESLHVTLKFLDRIDDAQVTVVKQTLHAVARSHSPFDMELGGLGAFPNFAKPQVWWIGVTEEPRLVALQSNLESAFEGAGFAKEERAFSPHVTIGRTKTRVRQRAAVKDFVTRVDYRAQIRVDSVDLMESHTGPRGAKYERVAAAMLREGIVDGKGG